MAPSNIGLVRDPLKVERRVRLPLELVTKKGLPTEVLFLFSEFLLVASAPIFFQKNT